MSSRHPTAVACVASFLFSFIFSVGATPCRAQSEAYASRVTAPCFTSIALKTDHSGMRWHTIGMEPGQLTVTNETLGRLIQAAYKLDDNQISGAPTWLNARYYDIIANLENPRSEETAMVGPESEHAECLRAILSDRFKLTVHRETRMVPVYALMVVENGAKLQEPASTYAGSDLRVIHVESGRITGREVPVRTLAKILSQQLDRPVLDETGLRGHYDVRFEWQANSPMAAVSKALEHQLGLKLELEQVPKEFLVIDHVETPSPN